MLKLKKCVLFKLRGCKILEFPLYARKMLLQQTCKEYFNKVGCCSVQMNLCQCRDLEDDLELHLELD